MRSNARILSPINDDPMANELSFSDAEFAEIRAVIKDLTGINMSETKRQLVYRRIMTRLRATGIEHTRDYISYLKNGDVAELEAFANAVTTNLTSFFRENHHFEYLAENILPEIATRKASGRRRLRIWSAGCSTGEEPYSIAMTLKESLPGIAQWDAKILCTDVDTEVIKTCKAGVYARGRIDKISQRQQKRWFRKGRSTEGEMVKVDPELQALTVFKPLNLMHDWPMTGRFDVIFCRNVIIYFDKPTQRILIDRFAEHLEDNGFLILGHSETLFNVSDRFSLIGNTIYQKAR